jgi:heparin binding hemagglutinin HbhA
MATKLKAPAAVYAVAGATDAVVKRLRSVPVDELQAQVLSLPTKAQSFASESINAVVTDVRALPEQVRTLPAAAQARVQAGVAAALDTATGTYGDLVKRGDVLVSRIRGQKSTQEAAAATTTARSRAKATTTTAKKAAKSTTTRAKATGTTAQKAAKSTTKQAAKSTAPRAKATSTTAKKGASATSTSAKAAGTTAQKAAAATAQATTDAAKKIGD